MKSVLPLSIIKRRLRGRTERDLINLIAGCYRQSDEVKFYLSTQLSEGTEELDSLLIELKAGLREAFWGRKNGIHTELDLKAARKILSRVKKITDDPVVLVDFMLDYADHGIAFSKKYGDMWEGYYVSVEGIFQETTEMVREHKERLDVPAILERIEEIVANSSLLGWGVHENLEVWTDELKESFEDI